MGNIPEFFANEEEYYKKLGIETEKAEIKETFVVPKGSNCNGCLHCKTRLKQYVNMFGDPTRTEEETYCDYFNEKLYENVQKYCCNDSFEKCLSSRMRFLGTKKDSDILWLFFWLFFSLDEKNKEILKQNKNNKFDNKNGQS